MQIQNEAEEHLRVIRSLMERATIYRAISAPTALVGGLFSALCGGWLYFHWKSLPEQIETNDFDRLFCLGWLAVLGLTVCANALFIWLAARRRGEPFISPAMRKALWALVPPMLCGAFFTVPIITAEETGDTPLLPAIWMLFYGLGLLATAQFAPKSIPFLGWCFLIAGLLAFGGGGWDYIRPSWEKLRLDSTIGANSLMVGTFGLFHLIYAACTWPRRMPVESSGTP